MFIFSADDRRRVTNAIPHVSAFIFSPDDRRRVSYAIRHVSASTNIFIYYTSVHYPRISTMNYNHHQQYILYFTI